MTVVLKSAAMKLQFAPFGSLSALFVVHHAGRAKNVCCVFVVVANQSDGLTEQIFWFLCLLLIISCASLFCRF